MTASSFLAQGTIYPDIVESGTKTSKVVKSHHNVGGLPEDLNFKLVEPLKYLFKDEVRACGTGARPARHRWSTVSPSPAPAWACAAWELSPATALKLFARQTPFCARNLTTLAWPGQGLAVFYHHPRPQVGRRTGDNARVMGWPVIHPRRQHGGRHDRRPSSTCPGTLLETVTNRIVAEVPGVNRVLYDFTPKPPATIEWE